MLPTSAEEKKSGLAYWAARVLEECDKASAGFAADPVHDLRVAIRRCRSLADGFLSIDPDPAWKQMKRMAKPLFSGLGNLRDTQVMLEWVAKLAKPDDVLAQALTESLLQQEASLKLEAQHSLAAFDRHHWATINTHLDQRTGRIPLEGAVFQHLALERWLDAHELHRRALRNRSSVAWHQLRIGLKRFRYTLENFLPQRHEKWARDLRDLQDALGDVHDLDALKALVNPYSEVHLEEHRLWLQRIARERQKRIDSYRRKMVGRNSLWQKWRDALPKGKELESAALEKLRTWASFLDSDVEHSKRVAGLALQLYDGLSQCGIAPPGARAREILSAATLMEWVGSTHAHSGKAGLHPKRARRRIEKLKPPIGWSDEEMRAIGVLVRFGRGKLPVATDSPFVGLDRRRRHEFLYIMGIVRLANALDEATADGHPGAKQITVTCKDGSVVVGCAGLRSMSKAGERLARARYLLETVCRCPVFVRPLRAAPRDKTPSRSQARVRTTAH
jgi:CHAD domain-containing protein